MVVAACSGGGGDSSSGGSNGTGQATIGSQGGTIKSADSVLNVNISAGVVDSDKTIIVTKKDDNYGQMGSIYNIEDAQGGHLSFSKPVTITLKYDPSLIPSGAKESELRLALLNPYDSFEFLSDSTVDSNSHVITATTTHFSGVAVLPQVPTGTPPTLAFPLHNSNGPFDAEINTVFDHSMDPKKPYYADGIVEDYKGEIGNASPDPNFSVSVITGQILRGYSNPSIPQFVVNGHYTGGTYLYYDGHPGYDYRTVSTQVPSGEIDVFAAADGKAYAVKDSQYNTIIIYHNNGYSTHYLHLSQRSISNGETQSVKKGDKIGVSGSTAPFTVGPHLHFEVRLNNVPIDPYSENLWDTQATETTPSTPLGFSVTAASSSQINLSWTASTGTVIGYKIYRSGTSLKSVMTTSASDTGLSASTNYCYYVTAYNSAGESVQTSQLCATTQAPPVSPPSTPTGFSVTAASSSQINLSWTAPTGTVTGYKVYKNGTYIKSVTTTSTSDTGLSASTNYCYYVTAYNSAGESVQTSQLCATTQNSTSTNTVTEFSAGITAGGEPLGITAGPDGNLWFTESNGNRIGRITTAGVITEFSTGITAASDLISITAGPDGNLWFAEHGGGRIGRITTAGVITEFSTGITVNAEPSDITAGPDGNLWFTENIGNRIGRITTTGVVTEFSTGITGTYLEGITTGPDGNLWFTENSGKIGRITTTGVVTEFSAGITAGAHPNYITAGPDGNLWFTESDGRVGRITTAGVITEFSTGITAASDLISITAGPDGNLWFAEHGGGRIGRITTAGVITEFSTGITASAEPRGITAGPDGNLWFTENTGNRIGRITPH